jgi:hypothetical protein
LSCADAGGSGFSANRWQKHFMGVVATEAVEKKGIESPKSPRPPPASRPLAESRSRAALAITSPESVQPAAAVPGHCAGSRLSPKARTATPADEDGHGYGLLVNKPPQRLLTPFTGYCGSPTHPFQRQNPHRFRQKRRSHGQGGRQSGAGCRADLRTRCPRDVVRESMPFGSG